MSAVDLFSDNGSPFDAIRQVRADGTEFWSGRALSPLMGYDRWENFLSAIERAMVAAEVQGYDVDDLFRGVTKKGAGRPQQDYELARLGAYLTVMNGDPRKPEVAAGQAYFAHKTREAETAQPALPDISTPEGVAVMAAMFSDAAKKLVAVTNEKKCLEAARERDAPLVAKAEAHTVSESVIHRQEFAREVITWGRKQDIVIRQEQVMRFLGHIGLFIRGERTDTGHATTEAIKRGLAFTDKGTAKNGHNWATGKLTARGQDYAWKRITKYVETNRTLELPRELRGGDPA